MVFIKRNLPIRASHLCSALAVIFVLGVAGSAQDFTKAEVFVGYSYLNIDQNVGPRANANGFDVSASGNFNRRFGLETDFSAYFQQLRDGGGNAGTFSYMAGPRINFTRRHHAIDPLFVHLQLGFQHLIGNDFGSSVSDTAIAAALGGGLEWKFSRHFALRPSVDYFLTHYTINQNNLRISVGLVYRFGASAKN